jgi:galactokinase
MSLSARLLEAFDRRYGGPARLFRAPGRINIIGEHTDYSEGLVMPAAIDRACLCAAAPSPDGLTRIFSLNREEDLQILAPAEGSRGVWSDYASGVLQVLENAGYDLPGLHLGVASDVPEGAGVSSSAALEVSVLTAAIALAGIEASNLQRAAWARSAEADFVGVPCGVMDQFISVCGQSGCAMILDCRTLESRATRIPDRAAFAIIDSGVRHRLVDGGYAQRRRECEAAAQILGVRVLRDAKLEDLSSPRLEETLRRRARHVISETLRVEETASALANGDLASVGRLMNASHASLRDDFLVTCPETDQLSALANTVPGVFGARQMGGGFGGAVLALCEAERSRDIVEALISGYQELTGRRSEGFVCVVGPGAGEITS